ncbi:hypothetical protein RIF29_38816 [Crotalaria pallida]|uniref:Uncharacterized protein n=1 Tax=Crotalaria pallida TaxID=3830 RepID=A0AAN9E1V4_CROPI
MGINFLAKPILFSILCSIIFLFLFFTIPSLSEDTAYDTLQKYDFPVGLLPQGVTGFGVEPRTGEFNVSFNDTCNLKVRAFDVTFEKTISGVIIPGNFTKLRGVHARTPTIMLEVTGGIRDGDLVILNAGIIITYRIKVSSLQKSPIDDAAQPNSILSELQIDVDGDR